VYGAPVAVVLEKDRNVRSSSRAIATHWLSDESKNIESRNRIVVIGSSAGGTEPLIKVLSGISSGTRASFFVVRHVHPESPDLLAGILDRKIGMQAVTARDGAPIQRGTAYVAPPGFHLIVQQTTMRLTRGPRENRSRPAIDVLFRSAAVNHGNAVIGVILSGMLDDGTAGMAAIRACGGVTLVQDPADAEFSQMPLSAMHAVAPDHIAPAERIPAILNRLCAQTIPPYPDRPIPPSLLAEVRFAERTARSEPMGRPVDLSCPDCGGPLHLNESEGPARYRCLVGHAYSPLALVEGQQEATERALRAAVRLLEERSRLLTRLYMESMEQGFEKTAESYQEQQREAAEHAARLRDILSDATAETPHPRRIAS
jgi:two-component system chemotaxis response regulator CheB